MNVCFIAIDFHSSESGGGIASYIESVSKEMAERGHKVIIVAKGRPAAGQERDLENKNLAVYFVPLGNIHYYINKIPFFGKRVTDFVREIEWSFYLWLALRKIIKKVSIDIIESQEIGNFFLTLSKKKLPLVIRAHGDKHTMSRFSGEPLYLGNKLARKMEGASMSRAMSLSTPSRFHAQQLIKEFSFSSSKVKVIPNLISPDMVAFSLTRNVSDPKVPRVLYTGRIEYRKGAFLILESAPYVIRRYPETRFIMAGASHLSLPKRKIDNFLKEKNITANIQLLGHVPREGVAALYRESDIFVMPSYYETFSISCVEAMVFGIPVIAAKSSALTELIQDGVNGLLVEAGNPKAMAEAILKLLEDKDLCRSLGEAGREMVLKRFDQKKVVDRIMEFYQEIIAKRNN